MRAVAVLSIACQLSACTTYWRTEELSPVAVMAQNPKSIRVERVDGRREVWYHPQLRGDTLTGFWRTDGNTPDRAWPVTDIKQVSTNHVNGPVVALYAVATIAVIAAGVALASWDGPLGH